MPAPGKTDQVVEIVVTGDLTFPEIASAALAGKSVTLTLTGATVAGFSALVGGPNVAPRGPRASQRHATDHVRIKISAESLVITEIAAPAGDPPGDGGA